MASIKGVPSMQTDYKHLWLSYSCTNYRHKSPPVELYLILTVYLNRGTSFGINMTGLLPSQLLVF